ncbi:uncharacterized protein LOC117061097 [Lacerta agilis]|uniref:uncharacterized protein LOC117061097 n=1 Tax=Lacerta agilis TaxID=80427 RepID=UPI00141948AE|nr:uncharacterized protein LOC117061097 [Lacerta agilis]
MSLNEKITEAKSPSPKAGPEDLHRTIRAPDASQYSTCPLCLRTFGNMLYVNPCLHSFCFSCTKDLLETKAECPCCKKPFHSVFHSVKVKGRPEDLSTPRHAKGDSSPTEKHPRREHASSRSKNHPEKCPSVPCCSGDRLTHPTLSEKSPPRPNLKSPHWSSLSEDPAKDNPVLSGFAEPQEPRHSPFLRKEQNPDQLLKEALQNETALNSAPEWMASGDGLHYRAVSADLSKPTFLEAASLLLASGAMLFICIYIYLSLVLIHK